MDANALSLRTRHDSCTSYLKHKPPLRISSRKFTSFDHPTDEMLEGLLLHRSQHSERQMLESHVLACRSCLMLVQDLHKQITATKLALQKIKTKQAARAVATAQLARLKQLALPALLSSLALAVLTGGLFLIPQEIQENGSSAKVSLSVNRDSEHSLLPQGRPVHVTLCGRPSRRASFRRNCEFPRI
jgi:hypothetical protein